MIWRLTRLFIAWKCVLLSLLFVIQKQYDTSSTLLFERPDGLSVAWRVVAHAVERLVIWDSVFFTTVAHRGLLYEHEWAFGKLWYKLIEVCGSLEPSWWKLSQLHWFGAASIAVAIIAHYLATLTLYKLTMTMFQRRALAVHTAKAYILSPAGIFLVAGYAESTFALLSFLGLYMRQCKLYIFSGITFALTCGIRGNGVLWGILFLNDLYTCVLARRYKHALSVIIGGSAIGACVLALQVYPYLLYCPERGGWCNAMIPSIFGTVQNHYWGVGFLKYWTPNNIPNFAFGAPTLFILYKSGRQYFTRDRNIQPIVLVQWVILISAMLVYHVQIITRIATCLPVMYWYIGDLLSSSDSRNIKQGKQWLTYSVCWCVAQGLLFAAFLPPA